jgi:hypothetical protein
MSNKERKTNNPKCFTKESINRTGKGKFDVALVENLAEKYDRIFL